MLWYRFGAEISWGSLVTLVLLCVVIAVGLFEGGLSPFFADSSDIWTRGNVFLFVWGGAAASMALSGPWKEIGNKSIEYTLSLPVTRGRILAVSVGVAMAQLAVLALVPSLAFPALAPLAGKTYPLSSALVHAVVLTAAGMVFYPLGLLIALSIENPGSGGLLALAPPVVLAVVSASGIIPRPYDIYRIMAGGDYFSGGGLPWGGLAVSLTACVLLFSAIFRVFERKDV